jgi:hypothetical protein
MLLDPQGPESLLRAFFMGSKARKKTWRFFSRTRVASPFPRVRHRCGIGVPCSREQLRKQERSDPRASAGARISKSAASWFASAPQNLPPARFNSMNGPRRRFEAAIRLLHHSPAFAMLRNRSSALLKSAAQASLQKRKNPGAS